MASSPKSQGRFAQGGGGGGLKSQVPSPKSQGRFAQGGGDGLLFLPPRAQRVLGGVPAEPGWGVLTD